MELLSSLQDKLSFAIESKNYAYLAFQAQQLSVLLKQVIAELASKASLESSEAAVR